MFADGCQAMLPGSSGEDIRSMCEGPKCGKVEETPRSVLVAMFGNRTHGLSTIVPESQGGKVSR